MLFTSSMSISELVPLSESEVIWITKKVQNFPNIFSSFFLDRDRSPGRSRLVWVTTKCNETDPIKWACVCVCVYMYVRVCVRVCTCMWTCTFVCLYVCVYMYVYVRVCEHAMWIYKLYMFVHICLCVRVGLFEVIQCNICMLWGL